MADTNERITRMARMAERLREHAASVSDEECRDAWTQEAADIDWLIARATATPPADAAPSNAARRTGKDRAVNALRSITADYQPADAALAEKAAVDCLRACAQAMRIFDRPDTAAEVDRATDAIAAALRARAVPDGFVLVPVEPTTDQLLAGARVLLGRNCGQSEGGILKRIYQAMLAASKEAK